MPNNLPNFIGNIDQLEVPTPLTSQSDRYRIHARNLLRHLVRGTGLVEVDGSSYSTSPLANAEIIDSLFVKRKKELMQALRFEIQAMLNKAFDWISDENNGNASTEVLDTNPSTREQCEVFLKHILAIYPFFDPQPGEKVEIPTKIDGKWSKVPYIFERIDISPTKGPLSWVLEDEDRIYAFGLKTTTQGANNHLLLMGTTYPGGQGSALADLYNIKPLNSVGEGHSFTRIGEWLTQQKDHNVIVSGHSKGATMAMIAAAKCPNKIKVAYCLNPAGLSGDTLRRYQDGWVNNTSPDKPEINVLINEGDIVPYLDTGYLPGTKIVRISSDTKKLSFNFNFPSFLKFLARGYEAHIHHLAGRKNSTFKDVSTENMNKTPARHVLNDIRWTISWLLFPLQYLSLFTRIVGRKISRFYKNNKLVINLVLLHLGAALAIALVFTGVTPILAGVATSYLLLLKLPISVITVKAIATALVSFALVVAPLVLTWLSSVLLPLINKAIFGVSSGLAVVTGLIVGTLAGFVRLGLSKVFEPKEKNSQPVNDVDKTSYDKLTTSLGDVVDPMLPSSHENNIHHPPIFRSEHKEKITTDLNEKDNNDTSKKAFS